MVKNRKKVWLNLIFFCLVFVLMVAGCSKVTQENYTKLSLGMDYDQVVQILGGPDDCKTKLGAKTCIWGNESKNISLKFVAEKLVYRSKKGL